MIKKILKKIFYNPYKFINKYRMFIKFGDSIVSKNFQITFNNPIGECLNIGNYCVLECSVIFETQRGSVVIGDNTYIGGNTKLISINSIKIGNNVQISWGVTIYDHNGNSLNYINRRVDSANIYKNYYSNNMLSEFGWSKVKSAPIVIKDDVWIGFGVTILKGVTIGQGAIVSANSVVTKDVEAFTIVMGNPAVKVKDLNQ
jgi:galactoside O-acetyltransferase